MGFPAGTTAKTLVTIAPNVSYPTVSNYAALFDLSKCNTAWWDAVSVAGDIIVYDAVADAIRPRHICGAFSKANKTGWISVDTPVSAAGKALHLCVVPGAGAVNAAAAHTNSGRFSVWGFDEASGSVLDKAGNHNITTTAVTYGQTGKVCKAIAVTTSSRVNAGAVTELLSATKFGVSFVAKVSDVAANRFIMSKYVSGNTQIRIWIDTLKRVNVALRNVTANSALADTSAVLNLNEWFYLSVQYDYAAGATDAQRLLINFNGTNYAWTGGALPSAMTAVSGNCEFGTTVDSAPYAGELDEIRMTNRQLSTAESFLEYKNMLDHSNFATYEYVPVGGGSNNYGLGHRFGFGF